MPHKSTSQFKTATTAILLALGFGLSAWGCMLTSRLLGGMCAVWTTNAFLVTGLVVLPRRWRPSFTAVCVALQICAHLITGGKSVWASGLLALINVGEAVGVVYLFGKCCDKRLNTPVRLAKYLAFCLAPVVAVGSAAGAAVLSTVLHHDFMGAIRLWFAACFLGSAVLVPMLLMLLRPSQQSTRLTLPVMIEAFLGLACFTFMFLSPNVIMRSAAIILSFPAVTAFAFRRGPKAAAAAAFILGAITLPVILARPPADLLMRAANFEQRAVLMQIYIAAVFVSALATALAVEELRRLRRLVERRTVSARRASRAAEAASRAKTDFLATMSHEIRTPMNSIIGFTEVILRRDDLAEDTRRQLGMVERSGEALLTVVNDILDFSKVEAGQVELSPRPSLVDAVAREAVAIVADSAERKGLELVLSIDTAPGLSYLADDHRLRQILLNLLNNAIKFTDAGSVCLTVSAEPLAEACDLVRFAVTDTGCGIPAEAISRLFQRFSQADNSITRTHGGTGLGLAICKGLAELMGGRVGVDSVLGEGSTFWIEVPLVSAEVITQTAVAEEARAVTAHVLLVDDHPINRELGVTVLTLLGCTADVACDGMEAIAKAKANRYDAILMDVHMPQMDGLAATRAIRLIQGPAAATPIIAMSADVMPEQIAKMREAGMVDSVGKPISIEALNDTLSRWVGRDCEGEARAA